MQAHFKKLEIKNTNNKKIKNLTLGNLAFLDVCLPWQEECHHTVLTNFISDPSTDQVTFKAKINDKSHTGYFLFLLLKNQKEDKYWQFLI